jgi:hypothetical protein
VNKNKQEVRIKYLVGNEHNCMLFKKIRKNKVEKNYEHASERGHCPTLKETENDNIKELAGRLEGVSHKETLANILEWEDRNITFWFERFPLLPIFWAMCVVLLLAIALLVRNTQYIQAKYSNRVFAKK